MRSGLTAGDGYLDKPEETLVCFRNTSLFIGFMGGTMRQANLECTPAPVKSSIHDPQPGHHEAEAQRIAKAVTMRPVPRQARGERRIAGKLHATAKVVSEVGFDAATTGMIAHRAAAP